MSKGRFLAALGAYDLVVPHQEALADKVKATIEAGEALAVPGAVLERHELHPTQP